MSDTALRAQADAIVDALLAEAGIERPPRRTDAPPKVRPAKPVEPAEPELVYLAPASEYEEMTCPRCWPSATFLAAEHERTGRDPLEIRGPWNVEGERVTPLRWHWFWIIPGVRGFFGQFEYGWTRKTHPCDGSWFDSTIIGCGSCRATITVTLRRFPDLASHADVAAALEGRGWSFGFEYGWTFRGGSYVADCPKHTAVRVAA